MAAFSFANKFFCITLLCAISCFDWSSQALVKVNVPEATVKQLREIAKKCEEETGAPATLLKAIIDWPFPSDEKSVKFLDCVCFAIGYTDADGHVIVENLGALPVAEGTQEEYKENLKECNKITKSNRLDTIFAMGNCVHESCHYIPAI